MHTVRLGQNFSEQSKQWSDSKLDLGASSPRNAKSPQMVKLKSKIMQDLVQDL